MGREAKSLLLAKASVRFTGLKYQQHGYYQRKMRQGARGKLILKGTASKEMEYLQLKLLLRTTGEKPMKNRKFLKPHG